MSELKERTFDDILEIVKKNNKKADLKLIQKVISYLKEKKQNGFEKETQVAYSLAVLGLDESTICSALLQEVYENGVLTEKEAETIFSKDILEMLESFKNLGKLNFINGKSDQVENYRKMFLAMGKDVRVIILKLAVRLYVMRTLRNKEDEYIKNIATETIEVYAPLANRLGVYSLKWELEDLAFKYLYPKEFKEIVEGIDKKREERLQFIDRVVEEINKNLKKERVVAELTGRAKHLYSIYKKMVRDDKTLDQIYDLFALRILVNSVKDCYTALGIVHELYNPMPGRFKDYIAVPKPNLYQSLHTTLLGPNGVPFEIQIRTYNMHRIAEFGIAAHWAYKEQSFMSGKKENFKVGEDKLAWIRETLEWQKDMQDPQEFMAAMKTELFENELYIFTPRGEIKILPKDSTPIDFAYSIHAAVGNKMVGAKINSRMLPITTTLKNGDIVEILTSENSRGPSRDWLKFIKSNSAKTKIMQWFKKNEREENIVLGRELFEKEAKRLKLHIDKLTENKVIEPTLTKLSFKTIEDMYDSIGFGTTKANKVITRVLEDYRKVYPELDTRQKLQNQVSTVSKKDPKTGIIVKGIDNCLVKLSKCCLPVPGDEIVGYITRGRGVTVHKKDCVNVKDLEKEEGRIIEVFWDTEKTKSGYNVDMSVHANDRNDLLTDVLKTLNKSNLKICSIKAKSNKDKTAIIEFTIEVAGLEELNKIQRELGKIDSVFEVNRKK